MIRRHAGLPDGATALGLGPGKGTPFFSLGKLHRSMGLDLSPDLLRRQCSRRILRGDAGRLPFASRSYDLAVESWVLHHVGHPPEIVGEMARGATLAALAQAPVLLQQPPSRPEEKTTLSASNPSSARPRSSPNP